MLQNLIDEHISWNRPGRSISAEFIPIRIWFYLSWLLVAKTPVITASILVPAIAFFLLIELDMESSGKAGPIRCVYFFPKSSLSYIFMLDQEKIIDVCLYILLLLSILSIIFSKG